MMYAACVAVTMQTMVGGAFVRRTQENSMYYPHQHNPHQHYPEHRHHPPSANSDPHLVNIRGERFDVFKTGQLEFLRIPYAPIDGKTNLNLFATIQDAGVTSHKCHKRSFITKLLLNGSWFNGNSFEINAAEINSTRKELNVISGGEKIN